MENWYYASGGQQAGPCSTEQLRQFLNAGQLNGNDPVWKDGMTQWVPVHSVPELASLLPSQAPAPAMLNYAGPVSAAGPGVLATDLSLELLRQTKPWVRLLSVVMFVSSGLLLISAMVIFYAGGGRPSPLRIGQPLLFFALGMIYIAPAYYLSQYASAINRLSTLGREGDLESALKWQKVFWKFTGVFTIVIICLYIVVIFLVVVMR